MTFDEKNLLFIHIPKTGGTSVANRVKNWPTPVNGRVHGGHQRFAGVDKWVKGDKFEYDCVCWCRNPYTRFESIFKYFNGRRFRHFKDLGRLGFEDYVVHACESRHRFFQPMVWWIEGVEKLHVYRFEDYEKEYRRFLADFGFPVVAPPHYRKSRNTEVPWTPELREMIYGKYRADFEFFDYKV